MTIKMEATKKKRFLYSTLASISLLSCFFPIFVFSLFPLVNFVLFLFLIQYRKAEASIWAWCSAGWWQRCWLWWNKYRRMRKVFVLSIPQGKPAGPCRERLRVPHHWRTKIALHHSFPVSPCDSSSHNDQCKCVVFSPHGYVQTYPLHLLST